MKKHLINSCAFLFVFWAERQLGGGMPTTAGYAFSMSVAFAASMAFVRLQKPALKEFSAYLAAGILLPMIAVVCLEEQKSVLQSVTMTVLEILPAYFAFACVALNRGVQPKA